MNIESLETLLVTTRIQNLLFGSPANGGSTEKIYYWGGKQNAEVKSVCQQMKKGVWVQERRMEV